MPLTYAIGDVHGRRDLLQALLQAIRTDSAGREARIIFLGDIIDRGPESRQCLDLVIATLDGYPGSRLILGNHEEFLLSFLDAEPPEQRNSVASRWLSNGGAETLQSYGIDETGDRDTIARDLQGGWSAHIDALRAANWMVETKHHVFVHGGIDPHFALGDQDPVTTRWIRDRFLDHKAPLPKIVVHGHTVTESALPELHSNRLALDTGAVLTGHLTCAVFENDEPARFLATDNHGAQIGVGEVRPLDCR